ncbi:MAG: WhiB family transcriptional regulator [Dermatophilaceae bacterium]|nr:WhiB family transcriptional regulator [Dermatophilaceae bacterium]
MIRLHEPRTITPRPQLDTEPAWDWRPLGSCAQTGPVDDVWMPDKGSNGANIAKALCQSCPVIEQCFIYAMDAPVSLHGVWAGMTEAQRRPWRRKWQARKAAEAARREKGVA